MTLVYKDFNLGTSLYTSDGSGSPVIGGAFLGNTVTPGANPTVETQQQLNPTVTGKADNFYKKPGASTLHEVVESYLGGKISQASGTSAGTALQSPAIYKAAHAAAPPQSGPFYIDSYDRNGAKLDGKVDPRGCADIYVKDSNGNTAPVQQRP